METDHPARDERAPDGAVEPVGHDGPPPAAAPPAPRPGQRLAALFEVLVVSGYPTQLLIMVLLIAAGVPQFDADGGLARGFVFTLLLADSVLVLALIGFFLRASRDSWRQVLFGLPRRQATEILIGLACVPLVLVGVAGILVFIQAVLPALHNVPTNPFEALVRSPGDALLMGALAVLSGGFKEEVQRAFVLHRFGRYLGGERLGLVIFSVAFGAGHFLQGWDVGVVTTLLGAFWGVLYLWRRSISASVVSHSGFNVAQILQFLLAGS